MRLVLDPPRFTEAGELIRQAIMSHSDQKLVWDVTAFDKSNFEVDFDMFEYVNQYWARQPKATQDAIFDIYVKINEILSTKVNTTLGSTMRISAMVNWVGELYKIHDSESIEKWITLYSDIKFPGWLKNSYEDMDLGYGSRAQTYLRGDYIKLICLAFALRMMIPVWGEYIGRTKHETDTSRKEYRAYHLLVKSWLFESEAMEKLRLYVERIVPGEKQKSAIIDGLSSEEFPTWLLAVALIRKICISDIRGIFPEPVTTASGTLVEPPTLVTYIFNHVRERIKHNSNNFSGNVVNKDPENNNGVSPDQEISRFESYKIKQEISPGDEVAFSVELLNPRRVANIIQPGIDMKFVEQCIQSRLENDHRIYDPQFTLMQWVMKPIISPTGLYLVEKEIDNRKLYLQTLGIAEAVLWVRGHHLFAGLINAELRPSEYAYSSASSTTSARVSKELNDEIMRLYPYSRKNTTAKTKPIRATNPAYVAIDSMAEQFNKVDWLLNMDDARVAIITGNPRVRKISCPHDMKNLLTELVVDIGRRGLETLRRYNAKINGLPYTPLK